MKNLADFKRRAALAVKEGHLFNFKREGKTKYPESHPLHKKYPDGTLIMEHSAENCKFGRVQSAQYTRILPDGRECWNYWGAAANWSFPDENTAVWRETNTYEGIIDTVILEYKFQ